MDVRNHRDGDWTHIATFMDKTAETAGKHIDRLSPESERYRREVKNGVGDIFTKVQEKKQ